MTPLTGLALGTALVLTHLSYDPQILTLVFDDGHVEEIAATDRESCAAAARAVGWLWAEVYDGKRLLGSRAVKASCRSGERFPRCGQYIVGFNAPSSCAGGGSSQ